ncbi:MAG TPA: hypothetical protein IGS17_11620 [Oscillatoriales cyanobacterium M59_W2019_021]|nr:hypothetical protein [Oscillatoriales cyanobacterium M59_W2019_021]
MLLTDKFVYIHYPKTGGTFVTETLQKIHAGKGYKKSTVSKIARRFGSVGGGIVDTASEGSKHATCRDIPPAFLRKPILSTVRNPYERYLSGYSFGWWKKHPQDFMLDVAAIVRDYPQYPEISFSEYVYIVNTYHYFRTLKTPHLNSQNLVGQRTYEIVRFFFKDPPEIIFPKLSDEYIYTQQYRSDLCPVHFLQTHNLNRGLYDFLLKVGYDRSQIKFILDADRILPNLPPGGIRRSSKRWQEYYTPELKAFVRQRDRLVFSLFPEFDV